MSVMKTDVGKLFLANFELMLVYVFATSCGCSLSQLKVITGDAILHFPI